MALQGGGGVTGCSGKGDGALAGRGTGTILHPTGFYLTLPLPTAQKAPPAAADPAQYS